MLVEVCCLWHSDFFFSFSFPCLSLVLLTEFTLRITEVPNLPLYFLCPILPLGISPLHHLGYG